MIPIALAVSLAGFFAQDCQRGLRRGEWFSQTESIYTETNFLDPGCDRPAVVSRSYGEYRLGPGVVEPDGAREIDFAFRKVTLTPALESVAARFRARRLCGIDGWRAGVEIEVSGRACDFLGDGSAFPVPGQGDQRYGIVREGAEIFLGLLEPGFDASSPELRPHRLDPRPYRPVSPDAATKLFR